MITLPGIAPEMIANNLELFEPTHPGEIIQDELDARGLTQTKLASQIGIPVSLLNEIIKGKRDVTIEYALLLEAALGIEADFWINMQTAFNKHRVRHDNAFMKRLADIRRMVAAL